MSIAEIGKNQKKMIFLFLFLRFLPWGILDIIKNSERKHRPESSGAVSCIASSCEEKETAEGWNFGILSAMLHENYWIVRKRALRQGLPACREPVPAIPVTGSAALPEVHPAVSPEQSRKAFPGNCAGQSYVSRPETEWAGSARPYR